ncbi:MAG: lipid-A-disaccharide synthase [Cyclobacteriaceae bacterium]|nr:lipid-A-disaccharide synthase [Cyclobacteriaceae bacterium]MDH4295561.1 lipid-A-disaccharide synthase [Cyclobacteriaceae bacterium]MDH5249124.1 lipid-A-disaccharide synthase [Cyclobacteriaceae bacterium]
MRYYIIAGERSGDLHGGNLVKALKKHQPDAVIRGFGGEFMEQAGVELAVHYSDMAFMGLAELITNAGKIRRYIRKCKDDILLYKPDVIILIDYGGFNLQIARFGHKMGIKVFYYIAPKYWAWYQNRVNWLKPYVDRLFVILPFETEFFKKFNWEADYVGNPVLDAIKAHQADAAFRRKHQLPQDLPCIALLPGSRKQELQNIIPLMIKVAERSPNYQFLASAVGNLDRSLYQGLSDLRNVTLIFEDTYNLLLNCSAAIVTSGTATLETGLLRVPQIVVYRTSWASYKLAKSMMKVPFISLINLIAGREAVKEMIQSDANPDKVSKELGRILDDNSYRQEILEAYDQIIKTLDTGSASENTARLMLKYLNQE